MDGTVVNIQRPAVSTLLAATPVLAVLRASHAREYAPVIEALATGGVRSIELTLSTEGVVEELPALLARFGGDVEIGVGTIVDVAQAVECLDLGAQFIVTPTTNPDVVRTCVDRAVPVFPGGMTPSELFSGWQAGATAVKVFPASRVGIGYLSLIWGPFPRMEIVPSGGVTLEEAPAWITAGACAVSLGSPLLGDAFSGGDLGALEERARTLTASVLEAVAARSSVRA